MTRQGTWSASDSCRSSQRGNAQTPYFAKHYTFTLQVDAEVTIDLSSSRDTFLYLLAGHGSGGTRRHFNDDASGSTFDSRLSVDLDAGDYTIEATTYSARTAGSFTVTVATDTEGEPVVATTAATVAGLAGTYSATVGSELDVGFTYEPAAAVVSVASVAPAGLTFTVDDGGLSLDPPF